jgi:hypothetical protein
LLGNYNVDRIDNAVLTKFEAERIREIGQVPSASVINSHNSALNRVFDEAIERGCMSKVPAAPSFTTKAPRLSIAPTLGLRTLASYTKVCVLGCGRRGNEN